MIGTVMLEVILTTPLHDIRRLLHDVFKNMF